MNLYYNLYCSIKRWPISNANNLKLGQNLCAEASLNTQVIRVRGWQPHEFLTQITCLTQVRPTLSIFVNICIYDDRLRFVFIFYPQWEVLTIYLILLCLFVILESRIIGDSREKLKYPMIK